MCPRFLYNETHWQLSQHHWTYCLMWCMRTLFTALLACLFITFNANIPQGRNRISLKISHCSILTTVLEQTFYPLLFFFIRKTLPSINLFCESTGSSICQKSNYWLFPVYSFCRCSWKRVSVSNQSGGYDTAFIICFPGKQQSPNNIHNHCSRVKDQKEWVLSEGCSFIRIPYFSKVDALRISQISCKRRPSSESVWTGISANFF